MEESNMSTFSAYKSTWRSPTELSSQEQPLGPREQAPAPLPPLQSLGVGPTASLNWELLGAGPVPGPLGSPAPSWVPNQMRSSGTVC